MNSQHRVTNGRQALYAKGKGIEPSTRRDRDYKSKVNSLETPPRRRFFQRILKVAASFFTPPNASTSKNKRKRKKDSEKRRGVTHPGDDLFTELGYILGNKVAAEERK